MVRRADPLGVLDPDERVGLPRGVPRFVEPMLATLTEERFSDPGWLYERKLDGVLN
jgi:bifunctional non-homologous end joining protein LigD